MHMELYLACWQTNFQKFTRTFQCVYVRTIHMPVQWGFNTIRHWTVLLKFIEAL
jgi:hypothetical protein